MTNLPTAEPASFARRVLVVDDDAVSRLFIDSALSKAGFEVVLADGGPAALAAARERPPDLVLLDFMMPGMTGPEVARRMQTELRLSDVPILLLTASDLETHIEEGLGAGVDDYLIKPIDRRLLVARVKSTLRAREDRRGVAAARAAVAERDALVAELEEARSVQKAQIPKAAVAWPGWRAAGEVVPCGAVGGDLFDVLEGQEGVKVAVLVDVSGHGVGAALVAASIRTDLRGLLLAHPVTAALSILNDRMLDSGADKYACVAAVEIGPDSVTIVNAGLPPVSVARVGGPLTLFQATGAPPGLLPRQQYESEVLPISSGMRIVLMSDGLTEPFGNADDVRPAIEALGLFDQRTFPTVGVEPLAMGMKRWIAQAGQVQPDDATLLLLEAGR